MAVNISLGIGGGVYASRLIGGDAQYMPDSSTILNYGEQATSNDWGAAALAALGDSNHGFVFNPDQDVNIIFIGNTGTGVVQFYDPIAGWTDWDTFTDAVGHVIRAPAFLPVRIGCTTDNATSVKMWTQR